MDDIPSAPLSCYLLCRSCALQPEGRDRPTPGRFELADKQRRRNVLVSLGFSLLAWNPTRKQPLAFSRHAVVFNLGLQEFNALGAEA